jgi:hypothetical protein
MNNRFMKFWFPLSINPEIITAHNIRYTQDAYNSIIQQLKDGVDVYDCIDAKTVIGTTTNAIAGTVCFDIDYLFGEKILKQGQNSFCIATELEAGDTDKDCKEITECNIRKLCLISKSTIPNLMNDAKKNNTVIAKERTCQ